MALFFEELLAGGEEIELGDESEEPGRAGSIDDGDYADTVGGHPVGHRTEHLVGVGSAIGTVIDVPSPSGSGRASPQGSSTRAGSP